MDQHGAGAFLPFPGAFPVLPPLHGLQRTVWVVFQNSLPCRLFPEPGRLPGFLLPFNAADASFFKILFTWYSRAGLAFVQFCSYLLNSGYLFPADQLQDDG